MQILQRVVDQESEKRSVSPIELFRSRNGRDIRGLPWIAVEVKRHQDCGPAAIEGWWRQTIENADPAQVPVLFWRANRKPWTVRMFVFKSKRDDTTTNISVQPVDIGVESFLVWFTKRFCIMQGWSR